MENDILKLIEKTEVGIKINKIREVYNELEKKENLFCNRFNIHCKKGCGKCCEHFHPDITEAEALFLAYGFIIENKEEEILNLLENTEETEYCPLYDFMDSNHHCTIYFYRPLICRLFGASTSKNKEGKAIFKYCKWNDLKGEIESDSLEQYPDDLVFMGDFGIEIDDINSGNQSTALIKDALPKAIRKLKYIMELENESK